MTMKSFVPTTKTVVLNTRRSCILASKHQHLNSSASRKTGVACDNLPPSPRGGQFCLLSAPCSLAGTQWFEEPVLYQPESVTSWWCSIIGRISVFLLLPTYYKALYVQKYFLVYPMHKFCLLATSGRGHPTSIIDTFHPSTITTCQCSLLDQYQSSMPIFLYQFLATVDLQLA